MPANEYPHGVRVPLYDAVTRRLPSAVTNLRERPFVFLCLRTGILLVFFLLVEWFIEHGSRLPASSYAQPLLLMELLRHIGIAPTLAIIVAGIVLLRFGVLFTRWQALEHGAALRIFILILALVVAWPFTTYGYNYFFDQSHYIDRLLIALLLPLIWWRPVFVFPFSLLTYTVMWQLIEPALGGTILAHKIQVLHVLNLFGAAFLLHAVTGDRKTDSFVFLTCCLVAAAYWLPAFAKFELNWIMHGHLYRIPLAAYAHGWLGTLAPEQVVVFAKSLVWFDWPMRIAVIVVEAGCLLFMWNRRVSIGLLVGAIVFHLGAFVLYGFLFWTWITLDLGLLWLLIRDQTPGRWAIYTRGHLLLSVVLIGFCPWWANPPALGWYDTPLNYTYRIDAVATDNTRFRLDPEFFAPYEDIFTMTGFGYLVDTHARLVGPYGVTSNREITEALTAARTPKDIFSLEQRLGVNSYNADRSAQFYRFLQRFISTRNAHGDLAGSLYALHPPRQFWSQTGGRKTLGPYRIREVIVTEVTTFYGGNKLEVIRELELARLPVSNAGALDMVTP